jgi:hypothetical protein
MKHYEAVRINRREGRDLGIACCLCEGSHLEEYCPFNQQWRERFRKRI